MKPLFFLLLSATLAMPSGASSVPSGLDAALKTIKLKSRSLENGALRIVMNVPLVSRPMYWTAVTMVCTEQWSNPKSLASTRIDRIEVLNQFDAQGFALPGGKLACDAMGQMKGEQSERYAQERAEACEAGVCRKRD